MDAYPAEPMMLFDKLGTALNILKYYGYLDQCAVLGKRLCSGAGKEHRLLTPPLLKIFIDTLV